MGGAPEPSRSLGLRSIPWRRRSLLDFELYLIIDKGLAGERDLVEIARDAIKGGAKVVQLRAKGLTDRELLETGIALRALTKELNTPFIVNDRPDVALVSGADGVHLGQDDLPLKKARDLMGDRIIGISTHSLEQALEAEKGGADYISVGPIFFSMELKPDLFPVGLELIRQVKDKIHIPFVAVGGIDIDKVDEVILSGARNVACASTIMKAEKVEEATRDLLEKIRQAKLKV